MDGCLSLCCFRVLLFGFGFVFLVCVLVFSNFVGFGLWGCFRYGFVGLWFCGCCGKEVLFLWFPGLDLGCLCFVGLVGFLVFWLVFWVVLFRACLLSVWFTFWCFVW